MGKKERRERKTCLGGDEGTLRDASLHNPHNPLVLFVNILKRTRSSSIGSPVEETKHVTHLSHCHDRRGEHSHDSLTCEMPALTPEEKNKVKNAIPENSNKTFCAAPARIYYAHPDPHKWSYAGLEGALVLTQEHSQNTLLLKLVDVDGTRGVIWEHELYSDFELYHDNSFFHSFPGDVSSPIQHTPTAH